MNDSLFSDAPGDERGFDRVPLAERLRPTSLDDIVGQDRLVGPEGVLRPLIESDRIPSMILWGPPGCGKTTLARVVARTTGLHFVPFSAVLGGIKEIREIVAEALWRRSAEGRGTILFVDEIHRFNRGQQDAFLPHVEDGTIVLIGATTENPSFALNAALLSRAQVFTLDALDEEALTRIARRALRSPADHGLPPDVTLSEDGLHYLVRGSGADGRCLLNRLESVLLREAGFGRLARRELGPEELERALADPSIRYDRNGEDHFNVMSAFHKSMRGGDPQAALHWLARMIECGEDPLWIARRIVRFASEDVGLADPQALTVALAALESFRTLGSPEGELALAEAAVYMASAPKSNAVYAAFKAARRDVRRLGALEVPMHLRNAPTKLMKDSGYGEGYAYPHDFDEAVADQSHLPEKLADVVYYRPSRFGYEKDVARRMAWWDEVRARLKNERE